MISPGSCIRCRTPLEVDSALGLCPTCLRFSDTLPEDPIAEHVAAPYVLGSDHTSGSATGALIGGAGVATLTQLLAPDTTEHVKSRAPAAPAGFELQSRLGSGGMGEVYLAYEHATGRNVAMKFIRGASNPNALERFLIEVRALAALDHPNIIRVLSADFLRAEPYFTMEVADGGSLSRWIETHGPLIPTDAARLMVSVARAIAAAHDKNILHRDLKPSNILLASDKNQRLEGEERSTVVKPHKSIPTLTTSQSLTRILNHLKPVVNDFGLAKRLDYEDGATQGSAPLGSPGFMPPEQISKRNGSIGPASDVYGLGATLFYLLTGRPPYGPGDHADVMHQVLTESVPRLQSYRATVPAALDGIVVKCLEKDPADRYPTATALAEDLERFLAGQAPLAPPMTFWRRTRRWASRQRQVLAASAAGVGLLAAVILAAIALASRQPTSGQPIHDPPQQSPIVMGPPSSPNLLGVPLTPDITQREVQRLAIERESAAGRTVELVGKIGPPRWFEWAIGREMLARNDGLRVGTFGFSTNGVSLLTLVRDPQCMHYRFEVELCHCGKIKDLSHVGLFLMFEHHIGANDEAVWRFIGPTYDEFLSAAEQASPDAAIRHRLAFHDTLYRQARPGEWIPAQIREFPPVHRFEPSQQPNRWRSLAADVTPNGIALSWRTEAEPWIPIGFWSAADLDAQRRLQQERLEQVHPGSRITLTPWNPRSTLGLFVRSGSVSFRNIRLVPKPQEI